MINKQWSDKRLTAIKAIGIIVSSLQDVSLFLPAIYLPEKSVGSRKNPCKRSKVKGGVLPEQGAFLYLSNAFYSRHISPTA
jgi:hypothetical protein